MKVKILQKIKHQSQSIPFHSNKWIIEFVDLKSFSKNKLTGWNSSNNMLCQESNISFSSLDEAIKYAKSENFSYEVLDIQMTKKSVKNYLDNYK